MITLKTPENGCKVALQTPFQKEFVREGRRYLTGELNLQNFRYQALVDTSRPCKVVFTWEAKDALSSTIEISKDKDFSEIFLSGVGRNRYDGYNFEIGVVYYWRVRNPREESEVFSFSTDDAAPRFMYFDGATNVRDIGGFATVDGTKIKQGLMFRGTELDMHFVLSDAGRKTMHDTFGIKSDIDFRGEAVGFSNKSEIGDDVNFHQIPIGAYEEYVMEKNRAAVKELFDVFADEKNYPLYFHCWGGADRTGCVAFTIEAILGLDEENLMRNFELTTLSALGNIKNRDEEDFASMINTLKGYGKTWRERMTNFLAECGVSTENIEKIRKIMLEKP